jgi:glycosyltransferase involved in cell wall biosynthesis
MKVLFLLNSTKPDGSIISAMNLMAGLHQHDVECYVAQPDEQIDPVYEERMHGIVEQTFTVPLVPYVARQATDCKTATQKLKHALKKNSFFWKLYTKSERQSLKGVVKVVQPDIIHSNSGELHAGYYAAKEANIPHVWHLREYQTKDFHHDILPSFDEFCAMLFDSYVITISQDLLSYFGLLESTKARCIYNGIMSECDVSLDFSKEPYFLCCSRISPEKGQDSVVRAFSSFYKENPEYRLVIAGNGNPDYIDCLKGLAKDLNCAEAVDFIGFQKDVKPLMRKARALVVASVYEGFGRMTAEACFCGCVVIGRNTGGTKEILNITGGFPYDEDDELLGQMRTVSKLTDEEYRNIALKAQTAALNRFSNKQNTQAIFEFYQQILNSRT